MRKPSLDTIQWSDLLVWILLFSSSTFVDILLDPLELCLSIFEWRLCLKIGCFAERIS